MLRLSLPLAAAVVLSLFVGGPAQAQDSGSTAADYQKALAVAQDVVPDAQLIKSRIEQGGRQWGFYFWKDGKLYEIEVSIKTFKVLKQVIQIETNKVGEKVSADVVKLIGQQKAAKTKLPEGRLMEIAAESLKDMTVSEVKYGVADGKLVLQFGGLTLDAATGKPVGK